MKERRFWLRRHSDRGGRDIRYALMMIVALLASYGAYQAYTTSRALQANLHNQEGNRVANVATWCGAINQGRDYDRGFVKVVTRGHLRYRLRDLPCTAIEEKTRASTGLTRHRHRNRRAKQR